MSVIWSGITEEGAVVPVQVTEEGKVVATGDGPQGDYLPITGGTLTGSLDVEGNLSADIIEFVRGEIGTYVTGGRVNVYGNTATASADLAYAVDIADDINGLNQKQTVKIRQNGSATFAGNIQSGGDPASRGDAEGVILLSNGKVEVASSQGSTPVWSGYEVGTKASTSSITANGFASFAGRIDAATSEPTNYAIVATNNTNDSTATILAKNKGTGWLLDLSNQNGSVANVKNDGSAVFDGDVVIGSRGTQWLIRESNGVAMLIEQTRSVAGQIEPRVEKVRDLPNELDLIEAALSEVMDKLKMVPPAGWPVWDGQSEATTDNDNAS